MRVVRQSRAALVLSFAVGLAGCGLSEPAEDEELGVESEELLGAPLDPGHRFAVGVCTGALNADGSCPVPGTASTSRCSGTLVTPNLVLTARHCVERIGPQLDPTDFCTASFNGVRINSSVSITTSDSVLQPGGTWYPVSAIHAPATTNVCNDDLVLLRIGGTVGGVAPAGIDLRRNVAQRPPDEVAIVGRGWIHQRYNPETLELLEFDNGGLFRRKLEHIPFMCASETDGDCKVVDYWSNPPVFQFRSGQLGYGRAGAPGDSGAGIYPQDSFDARRFLVIGVHSTSTMAADGDSSGGQSSRLDRHAAFIRGVVVQAALHGRYPVPLWAE